MKIHIGYVEVLIQVRVIFLHAMDISVQAV